MLPNLKPLATSGDGNCLLHAASLYMWGFHDRQLILRTALHRTLTTGVETDGIKSRWKYHTQLRNDDIGLTFSPEEWEFEWGDIIRIATNQPRQEPNTVSLKRYSSLRFSYESLEEVHVFALAHVLRRPIIVISDRTIKDSYGEDLAPVYFGGIYLPFENSSSSCYKSPIVLGYNSSHFCPLVAEGDKKVHEQRQQVKFSNVSRRKDTVIPLVTPGGSLLPVQFVYDPKKKIIPQNWAKSEFMPGEFPDEIVRLLEAYLDVRWIQLKVDSVMTSIKKSHSETEDSMDQDYDQLLPIEVTKIRFPVAHIKQESPPIYQKELIELYLDNARARFEEQLALKTKREDEKKQKEDNKLVPCIKEGCDMFGKRATNNLCSVCYKAAQLAKNAVDKVESNYISSKSFTSSTAPRAQTVVNEFQAPLEYEWPVSHPCDECRSLPKQLGLSQYKEAVSEHPPMGESKPSPIVSPCRQPSLSRSPEHSSTELAPSTPLKPPSSPPRSSSPTKPLGSPKLWTPPRSQKLRSPPGSPKLRSPPGSPKLSWTKKIKVPLFTSLPSVAPKKDNSAHKGYSRDQIKPITIDSSGTVGTSGGVTCVQCKSAGCEFFGRKDRNGYCSQCFDDLSKAPVNV